MVVKSVIREDGLVKVFSDSNEETCSCRLIIEEGIKKGSGYIGNHNINFTIRVVDNKVEVNFTNGYRVERASVMSESTIDLDGKSKVRVLSDGTIKLEDNIVGKKIGNVLNLKRNKLENKYVGVHSLLLGSLDKIGLLSTLILLVESVVLV